MISERKEANITKRRRMNDGRTQTPTVSCARIEKGNLVNKSGGERE
jgi:hypothetical protein